MLDRLQKPFLTVETGEAYQPIRLKYDVRQKSALIDTLNQLKCCEKKDRANAWSWYWRDECDDLNFESLDSFKKNVDHPIRLATLTLREEALYINFPSFKRACLALPFFYRQISKSVMSIVHADFINKVFGLEERLPRGFAELFDEKELQTIVEQRISDYDATQQKCEHAKNANEALEIIEAYAQHETQKKLPFAERHVFLESTSDDPDVIFLGFYIYLRSRELVAIRRWFGNTNYTLSDAAEETMEKVFGGMNIDIIE